MIRVTVTPSAQAAMRTLTEEERSKVFAWIDQLKNWDDDDSIQKMTTRMIYQDTYILSTWDDIRIFFHLDLPTREIRVLDISRPSRFEAAGVEAV